MAQEMMRAALHYGVNDIRIGTFPKPECPKDGLLMKVCYVTTCGTDVKMFKRGYVGRTYEEPKVFGHEASGIIAEIGPDCPNKDLKLGDRIMVHDSVWCGNCYWCKHDQPNLCENLTGLGGTWCEYVAVPKRFVEKSLYQIPDYMPLELAPAVEPMSSATLCADLSDVKLGDYVVVNGAGPLGLGIIRCISHMGGRVISCDKSAARLELAKKMGAEWTVQVTDDIDQVKAVRDLTPNGRGCDVAIEAVGTPFTWELTLKMARKGGVVIEFAGCKPGSSIEIDTQWLHYSHITIKGVFHATPFSEMTSFDLLRRGVLPRDVLITGDYTLDTCVDALEDHYNQIGVKNLIKIADPVL